jgi:glycosyltransferase involved in cell wall biosynthesis
MADLPKISIVTPSYNQALFLEETIQSVIGQNYPNLEYIIIDGGSTDGTVDIIKKYERYLTYWVSEKDKGQAHALNKGFARTTGEIMAYINADDKYCPWAFKTVANIFTDCPEVEWLTSLWQLHWNSKGDPTPGMAVPGYTKEAFYEGRTLGKSLRFIGWIQQESTFWRRSLWEKAGGFISEELHYAMDFELWARFFQYADLYGIAVPLGGFRKHNVQKTSKGLNDYYSEAEKVLKSYRINKKESIFNKIIKKLRLLFIKRSLTKVKLVGYNYNKGIWHTYESKVML